jgi:GNAT superfamily N-acetyltransferase
VSESLKELRRRARLMLDLAAPRDALAAYYALFHDPARTQLLVEEQDERVAGLLAICQTGRDLFRQFAVLRARTPSAAMALLRRGFRPRRPYYLVTTLDLQPAVEEVIAIERAETNRVYRLDLQRYNPQVNVMVVPATAAEGSRRFVIRSQQRVTAEAGINWRSPHFAEVYVWVAPEARGRGWGKAVVETCIAWVIRSGVQPLYVVQENNPASIALAESVGFVDTQARERAIEGTPRVLETAP